MIKAFRVGYSNLSPGIGADFHTIKNTNEAVKAGQEVQVTITEVDPPASASR